VQPNQQAVAAWYKLMTLIIFLVWLSWSGMPWIDQFIKTIMGR